MDASIVAAWWGAVLATIVFFWDVYRWARSGARLVVTATPNMQQVVPGVGLSPDLHVNTLVRNVGDASTTITHVMGYVFQPGWLGFGRQRVAAFAIAPGPTNVYPHVLEAGSTWNAWVPQSELERVLAKGPIVCVGVQHSMAEKAVTVSVKLGVPQ
jgi:hypothetical protein